MLPPQAHAAGQLLAFQLGVQTRACQLGRGLLLLGQLSGLVHLAEVADLGHAACQLAAQGCGLMHALVGGQSLLGGHGAQPRATCVGGQQQHLLGGRQRGLLHLPALPAAAPGQGDELHQAKAELALDLALVAVAKAAEGKAGVGQGQDLHTLRVGNAELRELGLQTGVVEQGDAHGGVGIDRGFEPVGNLGLRILQGLGVRRRQLCASRQPAFGMSGHVAAKSVGRDAGAAGQHQCSEQWRGFECKALHGWPP